MAVLISGHGSNMAAIARACLAGDIRAQVTRVIADREDAGGLALARSLGLDTAVVAAQGFAERSGFEAALAHAIDSSGAELVVLAGFMRILSAELVARYAGRILNIHPSLLPRHKGLQTHRRVLAAADTEHGVSVHFVTGELDGGPVILQARIAVRSDDTEQTLAARVQQQEHRIYPQVIGLIADGRLQLAGATIMLDGRALAAPIVQDAGLAENNHAQRTNSL
ncbi:MAG: phosphoribosylglycinamide formyltransferase [Steroidobacterales bacterium]